MSIAQTCTVCDYELAPALGSAEPGADETEETTNATTGETTEGATGEMTEETMAPSGKYEDPAEPQNQILLISLLVIIIVSSAAALVLLLKRKK